MTDCHKVLRALPAEPKRLREIAQDAGTPTRSSQAWLSCFAVLGRAVSHDVGRKRPLWSAASLPPKAQWLMAVAQLPAHFTSKQAADAGIHSLLRRAAEAVGLIERCGTMPTKGRDAIIWRLTDAV